MTYGSALKILNDLAAEIASSQGKVLTASQVDDLQTIAVNLNNQITTSDYVVSIFTQLVDGSPANDTWNGGTASATPLGDLQAGSTVPQLNELIGKWFLGTDLPDPTDDVTNPSQPIHPAYEPYAQPLFGSSGPAVTDIAQGQVGDCELCAWMIEMVVNHPAEIQSMFAENGNNTYGVRFYVGGKETWVTVNNQLPTYEGGLLYNNGTSALWADLVEKAYAQLSATGLIQQAPVNSYSNIAADPAFEVSANLEGATSTQFYIGGDANWNGFKDVFISAIQNKEDVILESNGNTYDSSGNQELVSDHAFAVIGYDSATGDFLVRNPWGDDGPFQTYDTQFEVSMSDIAGVNGDIAINNAIAPDIMIAAVSLVASPGQTTSVGQFLPAGQYLTTGSVTPVAQLFSTVDLAGLPITEYMFQPVGVGTLQLNGATNLANAAQEAQGQIVVSATDLGKLTFAAGATAGGSDLLISAYDGVSWSTTFDAKLTTTTMPVVIMPVLNAVVEPSGSLPISSLFKAVGLSTATNVSYEISVEDNFGNINLNGAANMLANSSPSQVEVQASDLSKLTYTPPGPAYPSLDQAFLDITVYQNGTPVSDMAKVQVVTGMSAQTAINDFNAGQIGYWVAVTDSAANVFGNLDALQQLMSAGDLGWALLTDATAQSESLSGAQYTSDLGVLSILTGNYSLNVASETAAGAVAASANSHVVSVSVADSAANIGANLDGLEAMAQGGTLSGISLTDSGTPALPLTMTQMTTDATVLGDIKQSFTYLVTGVSVADASSVLGEAHVSAVSVSDSAANVAAGLATLQGLSGNGQLRSVALTDGGTPVLDITVQQLSADSGVLQAITGPFSLSIDATSPNATIAGLTPQDVVVFSADASDYTIAPVGQGTAITVTANGTGQASVDNISNVEFLQFADRMMFVTTPAEAQIALLYQGALGRAPDIPGLVGWQNAFATEPATAQAANNFTALAETPVAGLPDLAYGFTQSTEFQQKYGVFTDTQFVTQLYANVLDRAPDQAGLNGWVSALAEGHTREWVLVGFVESPEAYQNAEMGFTGQTGTVHPAWLTVI